MKFSRMDYTRRELVIITRHPVAGCAGSRFGVVEFARIPRCSTDSGNSGEFHCGKLSPVAGV